MPPDQPNAPTLRLLCLSNGHGEDAIALRILQALQTVPKPPQLAVLPIVGEGRAYAQLDIPFIGAVKAMPSGGFVHMDGRQLARDIRGGLVGLTLAQIQAVRQWVRDKATTQFKIQNSKFKTQNSFILAVGDIVPLLMAYCSGAPYAFVGTAKSEYYLRDESGWLARESWWDDRLERWTRSVYHPWERWLMSRPQCKAVFPRDSLTTMVLQQKGIPAFDLGNPMMDGLMAQEPPTSDSLAVTLLPGSRPPEAFENWQQILLAVQAVQLAIAEKPLVFLAAIASGLDLQPFCAALTAADWQQSPTPALDFPDRAALWFTRGTAALALSQAAFADCLHWAQAAIAMAGTATEQLVGLGKPAIILPGKGPQFTPQFAEAQTRLLGLSVISVPEPHQAGDVLRSLLQDDKRLQTIAANGRRRLGAPGAADRIAAHLMQWNDATQLHESPNSKLQTSNSKQGW